MKRWQATCYVTILVWSGNSPALSLLSGKTVLKIIPDLLGPRPTDVVTEDSKITVGLEQTTAPTMLTTVPAMLTTAPIMMTTNWYQTSEGVTTTELIDGQDPDPPDETYPVQYASVPRDLEVYPLPLQGSDHELMLNVSWSPPIDFPARDYSLEVRSVTDTVDCKTLMCYEYNIPGDALWWLVPAFSNPVAESCAVRPGCAYSVLLTAHPWDGHTVAEKTVELDECVAGVCSCAHAPRLPAPLVAAQVVVIHGEVYVNVSWTLPPPRSPQRLPRDLMKQSYVVSIGKQMVTDAHPSPWFANTISKHVDADGKVAHGDQSRWLILPVSERNMPKPDGRKDRMERRGKNQMVFDVKLLARVNLIDDRGCVGPAGNATAYDPLEARKIPFSTYIVWATAGGLCVLAMIGLFAMSARIVKRVLSALRPAAPAPLAPLRHRPAWFSLQLRSSS